MKRIPLLILFFTLALPFYGSAQALIALAFGKKLETERIKLGLFLAEQGSYITGAGYSAFDMNLSLSVGAYTDIKLGSTDKWRLQNYIVFKSPKGGAGIDASTDALTGNPAVIAGTQEVERDITYFEITPVLRYNLSPSWSVGAGPFVGFRLTASDIYSSSNDTGSLAYKMKTAGMYRDLDTGIALDLQYRLIKGSGLQFNLRYEQGFINIYHSSTTLKGRTGAYHLGVGVPITRSNKQ